MGNKSKETIFLHNDMVIEILRKLSVKSLLRFKCVCKEWDALTTDSRFKLTQMHEKRKVKDQEGKVNDERFKVLGQYDGLSLVRDTHNLSYHIRNTATRHILDLPSPSFKRHFRLTLCSSDIHTNGYKLLCLYDYKGSENLGFSCEVLTLESDDLSWRPLDIPQLHDLNKTKERVTLVNTYRAIYIVRFKGGSSNTVEVFCIDTKNEHITFNSFSGPKFSDLEKVHACCWEGRLSFVTVVHEEIHVSILESFKKDKCRERKVVFQLRLLTDKEKEMMLNNLVGCFASNGKVIFDLKMEGGNEVVLYDSESKTAKRMSRKEYIDNHKQAIASLVHLKGMVQELQKSLETK